MIIMKRGNSWSKQTISFSTRKFILGDTINIMTVTSFSYPSCPVSIIGFSFLLLIWSCISVMTGKNCDAQKLMVLTVNVPHCRATYIKSKHWTHEYTLHVYTNFGVRECRWVPLLFVAHHAIYILNKAVGAKPVTGTELLAPAKIIFNTPALLLPHDSHLIF